MPAIDLSILNQRQTPAFYADVFANRPAAGFVGRIFVSTNTFAFYRDNGTGWDLIGGPGTGTITGSGTAGTIPLWNGASTIGNSIITQNGSIVEIKDPTFDAYLVLNTNNVFSNLLFHNNNVKRASAYYREDLLQLTYGTYVTGGSIEFETDNNVTAVIIDSLQNTTFYGNIIRNGGTSSQFLKADGSLDSSAYVTTNIYNGNGTLSAERTVALNGHNLIFDGGASVARVRLDADTNVARIFSFATNNVARWAFRIDDAETGSNAGSNFAVRRYDDAGVFVDSPLLINRATGQSTFAKKVVIENNAGDQQLQIVSTTAPSLRIDNLQTGATKRAGLGLSTTVNNFIQGSVDRDYCIFNSSTTASPILFGIYDAGLTNTQEAARISPLRNFLIGGTIDGGQKLQVFGDVATNGVKFPATQSPSADVNTLDDYEEGTFVPELKFGGNNVGMTYFDKIGNYTKIGRQVTIDLYLALTGVGSSTGTATITNLPFTVSATNRGFLSPGSIRFDNITYTGMLNVFVSAGATEISFEQVNNLGVESTLTNSNFNSSTELSITITYFV